MRIPFNTILPAAAIFATALVAFAQLRPDVTPGQLVIATAPHADIFLDDVEMGAASSSGGFVLHSVKPGSHTLRITKMGKHPFTQGIVVSDGKTKQVRADLADLIGDLEVLTAAGADVQLNGKSAGVADGSGRLLIRGLNEPTYKVRAAKAGRSSEEQHVSLATDLVTSITLDLKLADEVREAAAAPPADYALQRRLVSSEGARVQEMFFQASSGRLISIGQKGNTGYITQWDPTTGRSLETTDVQAKYGILAVSPDLRWAALEVRKDRPGLFTTLNSENSVQLVEAGNGRVVRTWPGFHATFTPDSKRLLLSAYDRPGAVSWDIERGEQIESWQETQFWILYSPDGKRVATRGSEGVTVRDAESGKIIQQLSSKNCCHGAAFSPDDRWLAVMDESNDKIELWEVATGRQRRTFVSPPLPSRHLYYYAAVFTPDSAYIVSITKASNNEADKYIGIRLLDTLTGRDLHKWPSHDPNAIALSSDGRWLALLDNDSSITIWKRAD